jgi:hypothetical protein
MKNRALGSDPDRNGPMGGSGRLASRFANVLKTVQAYDWKANRGLV